MRRQLLSLAGSLLFILAAGCSGGASVEQAKQADAADPTNMRPSMPGAGESVKGPGMGKAVEDAKKSQTAEKKKG